MNRLNLAGRLRDYSVNTVRPNKTEPIARGEPQPQSLKTILLRFVALLAVAITILAIAWSR